MAMAAESTPVPQKPRSDDGVSCRYDMARPKRASPEDDMADATEQAAQAVIDRNHSRSIPIPDREWASYQSWDRLLVCHWPIDAALLRPRVPAPLEIDTFDGQAFIGLIPMFMGEIRLRGL